MMETSAAAIVSTLFVCVGALLAYAARFLGTGIEQGVTRQIRTDREALWTGIAAALLLVLFVWSLKT